MASDSSNFNNSPSSADDDSFSSPVVSSSPVYSTRQIGRRRRRPSDFSTPPASRSGLSETTPTAPSTRTRHRAPSSPPSDPPPSSEAGGGDYDEDRPTYVWGTNISVNDVKKDIQTFLKNFRDESQQRSSSSGSEYMTEGLYIETIRNILDMEGDSLEVDAGHVFNYDPNLYGKLVRYPLEVLAIFDIVLMEMLPNINPLFEKHIQTRIFNLRTSTCLRNLNPSG